MSKYDPLWDYVQKSGKLSIKLTFEEIQIIAKTPMDHSFLKYKKELKEYGYEVGKISIKEQTVIFNKIAWQFIKYIFLTIYLIYAIITLLGRCYYD